MIKKFNKILLLALLMILPLNIKALEFNDGNTTYYECSANICTKVENPALENIVNYDVVSSLIYKKMQLRQ